MNAYTKLAKETINYYLNTGKIMGLPNDLPPEMLVNKAGVFVSLHCLGSLRGCIGTIEATTDNIALEIQQNALSAALEDPRFEPLTKDNLENLVISVDVLNPAQLIKSRKELNTKQYGIIVETDNNRGLLLPDIEGVDSVEQQIEIACQKAGIDPLVDKFKIYKFTVTRHE
ncbi:MAG: AmmeMemoRadiSam system protein A [Candidatus Parcubacteria bacterium]|nr:AmmeMemoRadiSam system protein A [Candidatus Parcubacteria bacterium]